MGSLFTKPHLFAVALALFMGGCSTVPAPGSRGEIDQAMLSARSKPDHEVIAAYFTKRASELRAKAQAHSAIGRSYTSSLNLGANDGLWMRHCISLAAKLQSAADESTAMAALHRDAAKSLTE